MNIQNRIAKLAFIIVLIFLFNLLSNVTPLVGQVIVETETATPLPSERPATLLTPQPTAALIPILTTTPTAAVLSTEWATETDSKMPSLTSAFTETSTPTATELPTEVPSEAFPTTTPISEILPPDYNWSVPFIDNFNASTTSVWTLGSGWSLTTSEDGQALQALNTSESTVLQQGNLFAVAVQARFQVSVGAAALSIRQSEEGSYTVTIDSQGKVDLYSRGNLLASTVVAKALWQTVRIAAIEGAIQVDVGGVEVLSAIDTDPLPQGTIALSAVASNSAEIEQNLLVDDFMLWTVVQTPTPSPEVTEISTPTAAISTEVIPTEPNLELFQTDDFDTVVPNLWALDSGWTLIAINGGYALQVMGKDQTAAFAYENLLDVAAQIRFQMKTGNIQLGLRQSAAGGYNVSVDETGKVLLYRGDTVFVSTSASDWSTENWHTLRLSAVDGIIRVNLDGVEVIVTQDDAQLPPGKMHITVSSEEPVLVDDFMLWALQSEISTTETPTLSSTAPIEPTLTATVLTQTSQEHISPQRICESWGALTRISVSPECQQSNGTSFTGGEAISADGRYITFASSANNIVDSDTNNKQDIFVYDRQLGAMLIASIPGNLQESNGDSSNPAISANGRYVVFESSASNLSPSNTNGFTDVYIKDLATSNMQGVTTVSIGWNGEANGNSLHPSVSSDGHYIVFSSLANNLVTSDTNNSADIFLYDRVTGKIKRISVGIGGTAANGNSDYPAISGNGRYITYTSVASNIVAGDTTGKSDIFVYDQVTGLTSRISVLTGGFPISGDSNHSTTTSDGRYIAFESFVTKNGTLVSQIFVRDQQAQKTTLVSSKYKGPAGSQNSNSPTISDDGRYIVYLSLAPNLGLNEDDTNNEQDIYIYRMQDGVNVRTSFTSDGSQSTGSIGYPSLSQNGNLVVFAAQSASWVPNDTNNTDDIFAIHAFPVFFAPTLISPINNSYYSYISHSWSAVADAAFYELQIDNNPDFSSPEHYRLSTVTNNSGVGTDGIYYWRVRGVNALSQAGPWSIVWNFTRDTAPPAPPILIAPSHGSALTDTTPTLSWQKSPYASHYSHYAIQVYLMGTGYVVDTWVPPTDTSYTVPFELKEGSYFWMIKAETTGHILGRWSRQYLFDINLTHRSPLNNTITTDTTPIFQWYARNGALKYRLEIATNTNFDNILVDYTTPNKSILAYTLSPSQALELGTYYWRVSVDYGSGFDIPTASWSFTIPSPPLPKPTLGEPSNLAFINNNSPYFSWSPVAGATYYEIQVSSNSTFTSFWYMGYPIEPHDTYSLFTRTGDPIPLLDQPYYWRVRGLNNLAVGSWSSISTFTVDTQSPFVPVMLSPTDDTSTTLRSPSFVWSTVTGAARYEIQLDVVYPPVVTYNTGATPSYIPPSPLLLKTYYWRVRAFDRAGNTSGWSPIINSITIGSSSNDTPQTNLYTTTSPTLTWTGVTWGTAYEIEVDNNSNFSSPEYRSGVLPPNILAHTISVPLPQGTWYWHVRARTSSNLPGLWSAPVSFVIQS